jgi:hypothetical protein
MQLLAVTKLFFPALLSEQQYITYVYLGNPYTLKKVKDFSVPSRDVTYQTLPGWELFPARESLVSDIPAWDGKIANLFYSVIGIRNQHEKKSCHARRQQASCPIRGYVHWHGIETGTCDASMTQQFSVYSTVYLSIALLLSMI